MYGLWAINKIMVNLQYQFYNSAINSFCQVPLAVEDNKPASLLRADVRCCWSLEAYSSTSADIECHMMSSDRQTYARHLFVTALANRLFRRMHARLD